MRAFLLPLLETTTCVLLLDDDDRIGETRNLALVSGPTRRNRGQCGANRRGTEPFGAWSSIVLLELGFRLENSQSEQPLTPLGIQQAQALSRTLESVEFGRFLASDLERAQHTARLLRSEADWEWDARLRELAKGGRQGFLKVWSMEQALAERERLGMNEPLPLLETLDDGWSRARAWLRDLVKESRDSCPKEGSLQALVVAHAGLYRVFLERLLGERLHNHPDASYEVDLGRFLIPNTSLTVLDVGIREEVAEDDEPWESIDIVTLTNTDHYKDIY